MQTKKSWTSAQRLIVAADFKETRRFVVENDVRILCEKLNGTGVCIKLNSAIKAVGYSMINRLHLAGFCVFADEKLNDIPETLENMGMLLHAEKPEFVTVHCNAGVEAMKRLKAQLPNTKVLGVTVLTSITDIECMRIYGHRLSMVVKELTLMANEAGLDGLVCSPAEVTLVRELVGNDMLLVTPGIRPVWAHVPGDDQNPTRTMTPAEAIRLGADMIVVGRPITQSENPAEAVRRTIEEIEMTCPAEA